MDDLLLRVRDLRTQFKTEEGLIKAVDGVDFDLMHGETLGIVGESGCGKSVTALSIMRLIRPPRGKIAGGKIEYFKAGVPIDITALDPQGPQMRSIRGKEIAMIFHQLSGGMRQRVMIAMALSCEPSLLIADEPTTALDVTIEAQILDLMKGLQRNHQMSIIIITHNLGVIAEMCNRVLVMYLGKVVETGTTDDIFYHPRHPYTQGLLRSIPQVGLKTRLNPIAGSVARMTELPPGCYFAPRCPKVMPICNEEDPPVFQVGQGQQAKCWLYAGAHIERT
jgi:oligopeptide/dipeptide ABC transporter ATP-binding protein